MIEQIINRGNNRPYPGIVRDPAVLEGNIKIRPEKYLSAPEFSIFQYRILHSPTSIIYRMKSTILAA